MDLDVYLSTVKGRENKPCTIYFEDGRVEEGVYLTESPNLDLLMMVIRPTGKTREVYEHVGVSDPNPDIKQGDSLGFKNLGVRISSIGSIKFDEVID
ncbi:MAG: hypothetical protein HDS49_04990 [Bacteroides sp.]|nr:hypothetical protein [Bacteroides sp.]